MVRYPLRIDPLYVLIACTRFPVSALNRCTLPTQIEEEENDRDIIGKLKLIGDNGQGLLMLDNELASRVFVPPAVTAA